MFRFYNRNPRRSEEEDCVCRAISTALGIKYQAVDELLRLVAEDRRCSPLCVCCYHHLLEDVFKLKVRYCDYERTVGDVAAEHDERRLIIRVDGHLTCSIMGDVIDIWDCSEELVDCYWLI